MDQTKDRVFDRYPSVVGGVIVHEDTGTVN